MLVFPSLFFPSSDPASVGYYLCVATILTMIGLLMIRETKDDDLSAR